MDTRNLPLIPGSYYHIYNCSIGNEKMFRNSENYHFFLDKVSKYLLPVCDIITYCLLPDHFHLFIRIKNEDELKSFAKLIRKEETALPVLVSEQFANCFNSYTKSFNKVFNRFGKLFDLPFKRIEVLNDSYYTSLIIYIHRNPVHHRLVGHFDQWDFSSYKAFLTDMPTKVKRDDVLNWFGNKSEFIRAHEGNLKDLGEQMLFLE